MSWVRKKFFCVGVLIFAAVIRYPSSIMASGIVVSPSYIKFADVVLSTSMHLEKPSGPLLEFRSDEPVVTYGVSLHSCRDVGVKPNNGYAEFPDMSWFVARSTEIVVRENAPGFLRYLELHVPGEMGSLTGRWQLILKVIRSTGKNMAMEVLIPVWIETREAKYRRGDKL